MRVGVDISQIVYPGTGVATYTRSLRENLPVVDQKNEYVFFGASLRRLRDLFPFADRVYPLAPTALDFLWNRLHVFPVENLIGKIDVWHSSDWTQPPTKAKKVTTIHDLVVYKYPESSHPLIVAVQKRRLAWVKRECDLIITDSESTKRDCIEVLGIAQSRLRVVLLAASRVFYPRGQDDIDAVKKKWGLTGEYLLAVGTREPRKNFERVVAAFAKMGKKGLTLAVAGKYGWGAEMNNEQLVRSKVKFLGYVAPEDLAVLYSGANFFVYPSLYEGFGVPVLEAMKCGCPVIAGNVASLPEVGGKAAWYVDPNDLSDLTEKMRAMAAISSSHRKELVTRGLAWAKNFSWEKTARRTLAVYQELES